MMAYLNNNNNFRLLYSAFITVRVPSQKRFYRNYPGHWDLPNPHTMCAHTKLFVSDPLYRNTVCHFNVSPGGIPKGAATYSASQ